MMFERDLTRKIWGTSSVVRQKKWLAGAGWFPRQAEYFGFGTLNFAPSVFLRVETQNLPRSAVRLFFKEIKCEEKMKKMLRAGILSVFERIHISRFFGDFRYSF